MKQILAFTLAFIPMVPYAHAEQQDKGPFPPSLAGSRAPVTQDDGPPQCPTQCVTPQGVCPLPGQSPGVAGSCLIQPRSLCVCKTPSGTTVSGRAG
jgi:hypothetical protein